MQDKETLTPEDWELLNQIRQGYLVQKAYSSWKSERHLELYDQFFGKRIADKWSTVLELLKTSPAWDSFVEWSGQENLHIRDWGCGTARASRELLKFFAKENIANPKFFLDDIDKRAVAWSQKSILQTFGAETLIEKKDFDHEKSMLLVSHVINELDSISKAKLVSGARLSPWLIWIENGTKDTSKALGEVRDQLKGTHQIVAPCAGSGACPALKQKKHWCHFFADRSQEYFTESVWADFAEKLSIDLRSIPYSFLIMKSKKLDAFESDQRPTVIGRPRIYKGYASTLVCNESTELQDLRIEKKSNKELYKKMKKGNFELKL